MCKNEKKNLIDELTNENKMTIRAIFNDNISAPLSLVLCNRRERLVLCQNYNEFIVILNTICNEYKKSFKSGIVPERDLISIKIFINYINSIKDKGTLLTIFSLALKDVFIELMLSNIIKMNNEDEEKKNK